MRKDESAGLDAPGASGASRGLCWQAPAVNRHQRAALCGQRGGVVWLTGLSGAGKSTIARALEARLHGLGRHTYVLDGDNVRHGLCRDLGFSDADRAENVRRIAEVAKLMADAGLVVIVACISPSRSERDEVRRLLHDGPFFEIFVDTPLAVAEARDPKGLYRRARRGELRGFTGIDAPYDAPTAPDLRLDTTRLTPEQAAAQIVVLLTASRIIPRPPATNDAAAPVH